MSSWKFSCETKAEIPLPPGYTFPQAFNYLNADVNSFYILESPTGDYLQCGGSKERCHVELRRYHEGGYIHSVLGRREGSTDPAIVQMSGGVVQVQENEVFRHWDAIDFFKRFFAGEDFPEQIVLRKIDL